MHSQVPALAHRDVKVENVLLHDQQFKLADFGSASTDTLDYTTCAKHELAERMELFEKHTTLMYRPPEMIDRYLKYAVTPQADVWMLGCVIFTLCFARHPFAEAQKLAILNAQYTMPDEEHERIGPQMRNLVRSMLTPDPSKRPSVGHLLHTVRKWDELSLGPGVEEHKDLHEPSPGALQRKKRMEK